MKNILVFCLLLCIAGSISALELSVGAGAEMNAYSREGIAAGGGLVCTMELNEQFDVGLKTGFFHDFNELGALEIQGLFRYQLPLGIRGLFTQAELGTVILFYKEESYGAFLGALAAGWRLNPASEKWYIEPVIRIGYPFIWGLGVTAGIPLSFPSNKTNGGE
ncbi:MAG: hypothetical protein LBU66_07515 [Treponema sp.]|jgi:hypothetical protein|nr:hypothetical protein [Treponema sp.]